MRSSPALAFAVLLAAAAPVRGAAAQQNASAEARALVARCATGANSGHDGLAALERVCPGLDAALAELGLRQALIEGAAEKIDADSLGRLLMATRPAARLGPDPARLKPVLDDLRNAPATQSLWQRIKHWFERIFTARRDSGSLPWLEEWLDRLTPGKLVRDLLVGGLMLAVIGAAVVVVVRELRASEVRWTALLRRRRRGDAMPATRTAGKPQAAEDWQRLSPTERPAMLFRYVAARLSAEGRLAAMGSDTHRELRQRARLEAPEERAAWQALARAAERQIYAPQGVAPDEAAGAVAAAARLWAGPA